LALWPELFFPVAFENSARLLALGNLRVDIRNDAIHVYESSFNQHKRRAIAELECNPMAKQILANMGRAERQRDTGDL
jgi:hypothetical protein